MFLHVGAASAQSIDPAFSSAYTLTAIGAPSDLAADFPYGGLAFENNNTLLMGVNAGTGEGEIYATTVTRAANGQITGFSTPSVFVSDAYGLNGPTSITGGIDGGLIIAPNGTLLYTSNPDNSLGEIPTGNTAPTKQINLYTTTPTPVGTGSQSVGSLTIVPSGFAGAGTLMISSFDASAVYNATLSADSSGGTYSLTNVNLGATLAAGTGPEGFGYVHAGNALISSDSVLITEYGTGQVCLYTIDANGNPIASTRTPFVDGVTDAEGGVIDPVTGDYIFSSGAGGVDQFYEVSGFGKVVPGPDALVTLLIGAVPGAGFLLSRRRRR